MSCRLATWLLSIVNSIGYAMAISAWVITENAVLRRVAPKGPVALAGTVVVVLSLLSHAARAGVATGENGQTHDAVWRVTDLGLYIDPSMFAVSDSMEAIGTALDTWYAADSRLPHIWPMLGAADAVGYRPGQANRNTLRFATDGDPTAQGALAITHVTYDSDKHTILDADIVVNGDYTFADLRVTAGKQKTNTKSSTYDLVDVLVHELGHFMGLPDDAGDPGAVMYPYFDKNVTRKLALGDGDHQALDDLYSASTVAPNKSASCSIGRLGQTHDASGWFAVTLVTLGVARCRRVTPFQSGTHGSPRN